jgi:hypothetical protein
MALLAMCIKRRLIAEPGWPGYIFFAALMR